MASSPLTNPGVRYVWLGWLFPDSNRLGDGYHMTIKDTDSQPQAVDTISSGPGAALRQAREAKGWTQAEVARRLNLRLAVIESMDSDHYKAGVALTFLRGYVKAYAKAVGMSEAQALVAFDSMSHEQFKPDEPMKSFSKKTRQQASDKWLKRISWLVFLGLLSSLVYWWWHDDARQQKPLIEPAGETAEIPTDLASPGASNSGVLPLTPAPPLDDVNAAQGTLPVTTEAASIESANNGSTEQAAAATVNEAAANDAEGNAVQDELATQQSGASDARLLSLTFSDDCWIKITDSQGKVLSEGVKKAQQSLALEGEPPFKVILGVPTAVHLEYLNKTVDLSSFSAGRSARLTVPKS